MFFPDYVGDPLSLNGCRHDCETDDECASHEKCSRPTYRCQAVCDQDGESVKDTVATATLKVCNYEFVSFDRDGDMKHSNRTY